MATLNTLRTRGGVIVAVVIGIALLAFLLGDLAGLGNIFNARKMRVGSINGTNIGYMEYANEADRFGVIAEMLSGRESLSTEDQDAARNMAWENLLMEYVYRPGFEALGIYPGTSEQTDMVTGVYTSEIISSFFVNETTGLYDPSRLKAFIDNVYLDDSGRLEVLWDYLKSQMNDQRAMSKYSNMIARGMYVTDLEVARGVHAANNQFNVRYIDEIYTMVADSLVNVSNGEIRKFYDEHKNMFRQTASREVEYVVFDVLPSEDDYAEAKVHIDEIAAEFRESATPMQYASLASQGTPDTRFFRESQLDGAMAAALWNNPDAMYGPVLDGDTYTLARLSEMKNLPDSIGAKHILLSATDVNLADSLASAVRGGGNFESLAREFSLDRSAIQNGGDLGRFAPEQMVAQFSDAAVGKNRGDVFTVTTPYGLHVVQLTYKSTPVLKAQIAAVTYRVDPGSYTHQVAYAAATDFQAKAMRSRDDFNRAVTEAALSKRVAHIRNIDRTLSGIADSREVVRWSFNAGQDEVSSIFEVGGDYMVAVVTDVREDGFSTVEQAASQIRMRLMQEKKAAMIAEKMKGGSLEEVAASLGVEVKELDGVRFGSFYVEGPGVEPRLIGAVTSGANANTLSKPVEGLAGVYAFSVSSEAMMEEVSAQDEKVRLEAMNESYLPDRVNQAILESSEVIDARVKFF